MIKKKFLLLLFILLISGFTAYSDEFIFGVDVENNHVLQTPPAVGHTVNDRVYVHSDAKYTNQREIWISYRVSNPPGGGGTIFARFWFDSIGDIQLGAAETYPVSPSEQFGNHTIRLPDSLLTSADPVKLIVSFDTGEVTNSYLSHEDYIVFDNTPPGFTAMTVENNDVNNVKIYSEVTLEFNEPIVIERRNPETAFVESTNWIIRTDMDPSIHGEDWENVLKDGNEIVVRPVDGENIQIVYVHDFHWFRPKRFYEMVFSVLWDKAGNPLVVDDIDAINELFFLTDNTPPEIMSGDFMSPSPGASGVGVNSIIKFKFDERIDELSLMNAFDIQPIVNGQFTFQYDGNADEHIVIFIPDEPFNYSQEYWITINKNLKDVAGINFTGMAWNFTTEEDNIPPYIIERYPFPGQVGLPTNVQIYAQFDEKMLESSLNQHNIKLFDGGTEINIGLTYDSTNSRLYIQPLNPLHPERTYRVKISPSVKDISGNNMDNEASWDFFTIAYNEENPKLSNFAFVAAPHVDYPTLYDDASIDISFTKDMDLSSTLNSDNYTLFDGVKNVPILVEQDMRVGRNPNRDFRITTRVQTHPDSYYPVPGVFHRDKNYVLYILPRLKDNTGINLEKPIVRNFRSRDTLLPEVVNSFPTDGQIIMPYREITTTRVYFSENVNVKSAFIANGPNTIPIVPIGTGATTNPIWIETDVNLVAEAGLTDGLMESLYIDEMWDDIDLNNDGVKKDFILEIYNEINGERQLLPPGEYFIHVNSAFIGGKQIEDDAGHTLATDYVIQFEIKKDTLGPIVNDIVLESNYTDGYPVDTKIKVEFSKQLNEFALESEAFYIEYDLNNDGIVDGEVEVDIDYYMEYIYGNYRYYVKVNPKTLLPKNADCTLVIQSDADLLQDRSGNALQSEERYSFKTSVKPIVIEHFPENGEKHVSLDSYIIFKFSEKMNPNSINFQSISINDGNQNIIGSLFYDDVNNIGYFYPASSLKVSTEYTVSIGINTLGVEYSPKDLDGNPLAYNKIWKFTTSNDFDVTPPEVISTYPVNGATNIPVIKANGEPVDFKITFSEQMDNTIADGDPRTISTDPPVFRIYYLDNNGNEVQLATPAVNYDENTKTATFKFEKDLGNNQKYKIPLKYDTIYYAELSTSVEDMAGNRLNNRGSIFPERSNLFIWSFKTAKDSVRPTGKFEKTAMQTGTSFRFIFSERMKVTGSAQLKNFVRIENSLGQVLSQDRYDVRFENLTGDENPFDGPGGTNFIPDVDYSVMVITPTSLLGDSFPNDDYTVTILKQSGSSTLTDLAGNLFFGDTTGDKLAGDENHTNYITVSDDIAPYIVNFRPSGNEITTNKNVTRIWVQFSENINSVDYGQPGFEYSIKNPSNFYVMKLPENVPVTNITYNYYESENGVDRNNNGNSNDEFLAVITLDDDLDFNTEYLVVVKNIKDVDLPDENFLDGGEFEFTFTTKRPSPPTVSHVEELYSDVTQPDRRTHLKIHFTSDFDMDSDHFFANIDSYVNFRKYNSIEKWPATYTWESNNTVLLVTFDRLLDYNSKYTFVLSGNIRDKAGNTLDGNKNEVMENDPVDNYIHEIVTSDGRQYLSVIQTNPYNKKESVETNAKISIFMSHTIDRTTVGYGSGNSIMMSEKNSGALVPADVSYLNEDKIIILSPKSALKHNTNYRVILISSIKNEFGKNLDGNNNNVFEDSPVDDYVFEFKTKNDNEKPALIASESSPLSAMTDYGIKSGVKLVFSEKLNNNVLSRLEDYVRIYPGESHIIPAFSTVEYSYNYGFETISGRNRFVLNITPVIPFANNSYYTINISSGITDESNNFIENPQYYSFRTESKDFSFVAFKNPAANNEIFIIASHSNDMPDLSVKIKQRGGGVVNLNPVKTNNGDNGEHTWFAAYKLNTNLLGMVSISAEGTDNVTLSTLNSGIFMDYGYINRAPILLADGFLNLSGKSDSPAMIFYNNSEKGESNRAPSYSAEVEELELYSFEYEAVTGTTDSKINLAVENNELPEKIALFVKDGENGWKFISKVSNGMNVEIENSKRFALLRDKLSARVKMTQKQYENPEFEINDSTGFTVKDVIINGRKAPSVVNEDGMKIDESYFINLSAGLTDIELITEDGVGNIGKFTGIFRAPGPLGVGSMAAYPNPASDYAVIKYEITSNTTANVILDIYDTSGRKIYGSNIPGAGAAGVYEYMWDLKDRRGRTAANGVYFYKIKVNDNTGKKVERTGKIAVLR